MMFVIPAENELPLARLTDEESALYITWGGAGHDATAVEWNMISNRLSGIVTLLREQAKGSLICRDYDKAAYLYECVKTAELLSDIAWSHYMDTFKTGE